jgi:flagellar assembly protein FliH
MADLDDPTFQEAKLWDLPSVDDEQAKLDLVTDAFNRPKNRWKYEAPDKEEEVKPLTAKEIEAIRAAAYQEGLVSGHEEGFNKGHEEGLEQGRQQGLSDSREEGLAAGKADAKEILDEQFSAISTLINSLTMPTQRINEDVKKELVVLATSLAKAIIKTEVLQNPQILTQAISEGIKTLPLNEQHYQISLHGDDIALVTAHFGEEFIKDNNWQLIESVELARGGCNIHTTANAVDVSIERRSEQVFNQLLLNQGLADDPRTR